MRLLACHDCKTLEEVPDFDGPSQYDEALAAAVARHRSNGEPHMGAPLMWVADSDWADDKKRAGVLAEIKAGLFSRPGTGTGLGDEAYALMNTFRDDAMTCWIRDHNRNPACSDYKSDAKRLIPNTVEERKELGLSPVHMTNANTRYLCEFCPVHVLVQEAAKRKAGLYS